MKYVDDVGEDVFKAVIEAIPLDEAFEVIENGDFFYYDNELEWVKSVIDDYDLPDFVGDYLKNNAWDFYTDTTGNNGHVEDTPVLVIQGEFKNETETWQDA
jgi:hypothetical protein